MKKIRLIIIISFFVILISALFGSKKHIESSQYKCMIQMKNYSGEGAYIVISLLNTEGKYDQTLYVQGDDDEWFSEITK